MSPYRRGIARVYMRIYMTGWFSKATLLEKEALTNYFSTHTLGDYF
jgi:hypothetical protein